MLFNSERSVLEHVRYTDAQDGRVFDFYVKRDDLIDPLVSGNKWRKLKYNIEQARHKSSEGILSFGGAHSNHLVATAKACHVAGLKSVGFVRGEELSYNSNSTLMDCAQLGMELVFISREEYRNKEDWEYMNQVRHGFPSFHIVPEGGSNFYGIIGCQEILKETPNDFDHVFVSAGTGTTAAGVILSAGPHTKVHVVSALKGDFMEAQVSKMLNSVVFDEELVEELKGKTVFHDNAHFGGYAKTTPELLRFIKTILAQTQLPIDSVYTGKALYELLRTWKKGELVEHPKVLFIHTGGLQGMRS
ncbi:MAG: pyridoxal-phosphate dependent enzyme [Crocinitomicaceae bacterium]|nr:pyridoxal-phosphate dependent enzyme [Crocinitomicaceae bacterium]